MEYLNPKAGKKITIRKKVPFPFIEIDTSAVSRISDKRLLRCIENVDWAEVR